MKQEMRAFNIQIPKDLWLYLKKIAAENETSMVGIIKQFLEKHRRNSKKVLTED